MKRCTRSAFFPNDPVDWILVVLVFLTPLLFIPQCNSVYVLPKWTLIGILSLVGLAALLFRERELSLSAAQVPLAIFVVLAFVAFALNPHKYDGVWRLKEICFFAALFLLAQNAREKRNIIRWSLFALLIVSVIGLTQYIWWNCSGWPHGLNKEIVSTLGHPNYLAGYLILLLPVSTWLAVRKGSAGKRVFFALCSLLSVVCLALTGSRGGWAGAVAGSLVALIMVRKKGAISMRARVLLYSLPVILLAIAGLVYHKRGMKKNEAITARIILYKAADQLIREKPLTGHGPGSFVVSANSYLSVLERRSEYGDSLYKLRPVIRYAGKVHNEYLEIAVEEGILGLIVFLLLVLFSLKRSLTRDYGILSGIVPGVCAVLVQSIVSFPLRSPAPGALFFVMLGLIAPRGRTIVLRVPRLVRLLILPCVALGVFWILKPLIADCYFARGKRLGKIELLEKSARWYPVSQELYFNLSRDYMRKGKYEDAIGSGEKAVDIQPFHEIAHFQLGCAYEGLNDDIKATEEYRQAISLNPEFFVAYSRLSELYLRQGKKNVARSVLKKALTYRDSVACVHNSLGLVWMHLGNRERAVEDFRISMSTLERNLVAICNKHTVESQGGTDGLIDGKAYEWISIKMARGTNALLRSDFLAAKSVFNEILARYPSYASALAALGTAYYRSGNHEKARDCWRKAVEIDPEDETTLRNLVLLGK